MATSKPKYNIKAVSKMIGIQPGTLRAWERRYKIIRPSRNEAGHRLYTDHHVRILKWLMEKIDQGFTISQAVSLLENKEELSFTGSEKVQLNQLDKIADDLLNDLLTFNENHAQKQLDHAFSLFTFETVAIEVIGPLLVKIGELWEEKRITSAHEHFASQFIRSRIGHMLLSIPSDGILPKALLVCAPDERHELGLLIFALYLKRKGYNVVYLGQSIAREDTEAVIEEIKPSFMFMSCTLKKNIPNALTLVDDIKKHFPNLEIGLGGSACHHPSDMFKEQIKSLFVGNSKQAWEHWLENNSES